MSSGLVTSVVQKIKKLLANKSLGRVADPFLIAKRPQGGVTIWRDVRPCFIPAKAGIHGSLVFAVLAILSLTTPALAQTTPTLRENQIGQACATYAHSTDFDTIAQCNNTTGGTFQKAPLFIGTLTSPPYTDTLCDANKAGMLQWTGTAFQGCNGTSWFSMGGAMALNDLTDAKTDYTTTYNMFLGSGAGDLITTGTANTALGVGVLTNLTSGNRNTAVGFGALISQNTGYSNTIVGAEAGAYLTSGHENVAMGNLALYANLVNHANTALGSRALQNSRADNNTGIGYSALNKVGSGTGNIGVGVTAGYNVTSGSYNVVLGYSVAGVTLTTGSNNILIGTSSLVDTPAADTSNYLNIGNAIKLDMTNVTASGPIISMGGASLDNTSIGVGLGSLQSQTATSRHNTAVGNLALGTATYANDSVAIGSSAQYLARSGYGNVAVGSSAMYSNYTNGYNTAVGVSALSSARSGYNTAIGAGALYMTSTVGYNSALGASAGYSITSGAHNIALGPYVASTTLTTGSSNILIGTSSAVDTPAADTNNWLNIGNTIYGDLSTGSVAIGAAAVTAGAALDMSGRTDSLLLPKGTTAQEPTGVTGMVRYNTDTNAVEVYQGATPAWVSLGASGTGAVSAYLGSSAASTSPSRSDDVTTGLFSDTASTVSIAISGTERLRTTASNVVWKMDSSVGEPYFSFSMAGFNNLAGQEYNGDLTSLFRVRALSYSGNAWTGGVSVSGASGTVAKTGLSLDGYIASTASITTAPATSISGLKWNGGSGSAYLTGDDRILGITPNGGTTYTALFTATGDFTTTGKVGVGVASPVQSLDVNGNINVSTATGAYYIGNAKIMHQPVGDTTSIGVGPSTLAAQTGTGLYNTAVGSRSLMAVTSGYRNVAVGRDALMSSVTGYENTAVGVAALTTNTTGYSNVAVGPDALSANTSGSSNIAIGRWASRNNATGSGNIAIGEQALYANTLGNSNNIVLGWYALRNGVGSQNVAMGAEAMRNNVSSANNIAIGYMALTNIATAYDNTVLGSEAGKALNTGTSNLILGRAVGKTTLGSGSSNILIGTSSLVDTPAADTSNYLNIGNAIKLDMTNVTATNPIISMGGASLDNSSIGVGLYSLQAQTATNLANTAVGKSALKSTINPNNTGVGNSALMNNVSGAYNAALGMRALEGNVNSYYNTAVGAMTMLSAAGNNNTAIGSAALNGVTGTGNTALGSGAGGALRAGVNNLVLGISVASTTLTTGSSNILIGTSSLVDTPAADTSNYLNIGNAIKLDMTAVTATNPIISMGGASLDNTSIGVGLGALAGQTTTNLNNTAVGKNAMFTFSSGANNTAVGRSAMSNSATGTGNTAVGVSSLGGTSAGAFNSAVGYNALSVIAGGTQNTAVGYSSLSSTTTGVENTAVGTGALLSNVNGSQNAAFGMNSLYYSTSGAHNAALGRGAGRSLLTGSNNLFMGYYVASTTLTTGSSNILIGTSSLVDTPAADTSNWLNIGNTIYGDLSLGSVAIGAPAITSGSSLDMSARTDSVLLPKGTNAQQPVGVEGMIRFNTDAHAVEVYQGTAWLSLGMTSTAGSTQYLGADATHTSPSRSDDVTTGLFSDVAASLGFATGGAERLRITATGSVGVGVSAPVVALDVNGAVKLANDASSCSSSLAGAIRWTSSAFQGCNGSAWGNMPTVDMCAGPAALAFSNQTGVAVSTEITSDAQTLSGFSCTAAASCTGCTILKNGILQGTTANFVSGDTIAIRLTSSSSYGATSTASVSVGQITSGTWSVTTTADTCSGTPTVGQVCSDGTVYAGTTPDGNSKMYVTPCDYGMTWDGSSCTGTRITKTWSTGATISTGVTSGITGKTNTASLYALNGNADGPYNAATYCQELVAYGHGDWYLPSTGELSNIWSNRTSIGNLPSSGVWSSTESSTSNALYLNFANGYIVAAGKAGTYYLRCARNDGAAVSANPTSASAFNFTNQTNVATSTTITSNAVTLSGFTGTLSATCGSGCTAIARNGVWGSTTVAGFQNGDTIAIRQTSSATASTTTNATVTVGTTVSGTWGVTTTSDTPTAFGFTDQTGVYAASRILSDTATLSGFTGTLTATCNTNCLEIARNGVWSGATTLTGFVTGNTIRIKQLSSSSSNTASTATVTVGSTTSNTWTVTTRDDPCPGAATPGYVCPDGTIYAGISPDGNEKMYTTRCDAGMTWDGSACTGTRTLFSWNNNTSNWVVTGYTSQTTGRGNTTGLVALLDIGAPYNAAVYCDGLTTDGHSDWYLPAENELALYYANVSAIGNFLTDGTYYWSSTESTNVTAYYERLSDGSQNNGSKNADYPIRCARR